MVVLGLDAAWTAKNPSGAALVIGEPGKWHCVSASVIPPGWSDLVASMEAIAGAPVTLASVDMPLSTTPITSRRTCDTLISRNFGARGCSVHSPSAQRPGAVSTELMTALTRAGYELAVHGSIRRDRQVIEVYPHIAVMRLLNEGYRVPYKIGRAGKYWPAATAQQRQQLIRESFARILGALQERISGIPLQLPPADAGPADLKRFEDALDGVVCAWIGTRYLEGECQAYGDETAAIWVPSDADSQGR